LSGERKSFGFAPKKLQRKLWGSWAEAEEVRLSQVWNKQIFYLEAKKES